MAPKKIVLTSGINKFFKPVTDSEYQARMEVDQVRLWEKQAKIAADKETVEAKTLAITQEASRKAAKKAKKRKRKEAEKAAAALAALPNHIIDVDVIMEEPRKKRKKAARYKRPKNWRYVAKVYLELGPNKLDSG